MNERKRRVLWKRTTAYLLTLALCFSMFTGTGFTSYASETGTEPLELSQEQETDSESAEDALEETESAEEETGEESAETGIQTGEEESGESEAAAGEEENGETKEEDGETKEEDGESKENVGDSDSSETDAGEEIASFMEAEDPELVGTDSTYIGDVNETDVSISLDIDVEKMGDDFTEDGIKALLAHYKEQQFTHIMLNVSESGKKVIDCKIYNALLPYLDSTQSRFIYYRFAGDTYINWCFGEPKQIEDITEINAGVAISVANGKATVNMEADAADLIKCADFLEVGLGYPTETETAKALEELFGTEYKKLNVLSENEDRVSYVYVNWNPNEGSDFLYIQNIQNVNSHSFVVGEAPYKGDLWDDGTLSISGWEMGESFTAEGIRSLLSTYYSDQKFSCIYFQQDLKEDNLISKDILNGVIPYLTEGDSLVVFSFNGSEEGITWRIQSPEAMEEDVSANIVIDVDDNNTVSATVPDTSLLSEKISVGYWVSDRSALKKKLTEALGTIGRTLSLFAPGESKPLQNASIYYWWNNDNGCSLDFHGIHNLQSGIPYVIKDNVYRGDVWSDENGSSIYISSRALNKAKFGSGELAEIINYYAEQGITFDTVGIQEDYSANNIIKKDYYNLARKILNTDKNSELTFVFCRCEDREQEGVEPIAQSDLNWHFRNPGEISADINANVSLKAEEGYGVTLKLAATNKYNAENVEVSFYVEENDVELAGQLEAALGKALNEGSEVITLKSGTTTEDGVYVSCGRDARENDNDRIFLTMNSVQNWASKTDYVVAPVKNIETVYDVGTKVELRENKGDFKLSNTPSTTTSGNMIVPKVTWRSHTADAVMFNYYEMSILDERDDVYVSASYTGADNKKCLDVFRFRTEKRVTQIKFDKTKLTMKLEKNDDGEYEDCREYLDIKCYPSDMGCNINDPEEIIWKTYDPSVAVIDKDDDGNICIKAVGPGRTWVTAIYCKDYSEEPEMSPVRTDCEIVVLDAITIADEDWPDYNGKLVAVTNFDTKLGDIDLPYRWEWVDPDTSLTPFKDMDGHSFAATYTDYSDVGVRTETYSLWVRMVTITGVSIVAVEPVTGEEDIEWIETELPKTITGGEAITLQASLAIKNGEMSDLSDDILSKLKAGWTSSPAGIGSYEGGLYTFAPDDTDAGKKAGKKIFTATVTNKDTGKALFKNSCSITVTQKPVVNFYEDVLDPFVDTENQKIIINIRSDKYSELTGKKLTVKSEDASILKLGTLKEEGTWTDVESEAEYTELSVPYTKQKGNGLVYLTVTAMDEAKSSRSYALYDFLDTEPKLQTPVISMNRQKADTATPVGISFEDGSLVVPKDGIELTGSNSDRFDLRYEVNELENYEAEDDYGYLDRVWLSLKEDAALKGKNQVTIRIPVARLIYSEEGTIEDIQEVGTYDVTVTVNITDSVPSVTFKQSGKVNAFYTDDAGAGILTFTVKDGTAIEELNLTGCDYTLESTENENQYRILLRDDTDGTSKNGTLTYKLKGYRNEVSKSFKVATENKKPTIVLSAKSDTLYPNAGYGTVVLSLTDKSTGDAIEISSARYVEDKKNGVLPEIPEAIDETTVPLNKTVKYNTYDILHEGEKGVITFSLTGDFKAKTDKVALQVKEANWRDYVDVSFSIKTDTTEKPKLKLSSSTVTLNNNIELYQSQQAKVGLSLSGCSNLLNDETDVWFTGKDTKSTDVLKIKGSLVLQYWNEEGNVVVRLNDNSITDGTYKYDVWVRSGNFTVSAPLTIKVKNTKPDKCISVSAKGSIDVLDREGTEIVYTPKLSNVTGEVQDGWLTGQDADMFGEPYFKDGKLYVKAREGASYSTKYTYKVKAVFKVQTEDYRSYELESKELSIKVKQGKPKVSVSSVGNTLYRSTGNCVEVNISALLGSKDVVIEDVALVNYTEDLMLVGDFYNPDTKSVLLTTTGGTKSILKGGKTWSVKLAVHYRDQAGNEKDTQVTYKVCVK